MKKSLLIALAILLVFSCKKQKLDPEGPTDVRIKNLTTFTLKDVTINLDDEVVNFGEIGKQDTSKYHRFKKTHPLIKVSATVETADGKKIYKTEDNIDYTYQQYMGQMRVTYEIYVKSGTAIETKVITDEPLILDEEYYDLF